MASCNCFSFKVSPAVAAATAPEAGSPHRHLSSLLHHNTGATFHKAPTLRTAGRRPPTEAAPFIWRSFFPRPAAEDDSLSDKDGGASVEPKSPLEELAAKSPVAKLVLKSPVAKLVEKTVSVSPVGKLVEKTVSESPVAKLVEKTVSESPAAKLVEEAVLESPAAKQVEETVLESPAAKLVEEVVLESPAAKLVEEVLESPAAMLVEEVLESPAAKLVEEVEAEVGAATEGELLKMKLLELLKGTDRGLLASSEATAEMLELISRLEALNPTPAPTDDLALLDGKWILAYSSSLRLPHTLRQLLSALPIQLVKVDEISQDIDAENSTLQNSVKILFGPLVAASLGTNAKFEVQSHKRVLITCTEGLIGAPQFLFHAFLPDMHQIKELLGQHIDLSPLESAMSSFQGKEPLKEVLSSIPEAEPLKGVMNSIEEAAPPLKGAVDSIEDSTEPLKALMSAIEEAAAPLKAVGSSMQDAASSVTKAIADQVKPLKIPIPNPGPAASSWLLTTYLDKGMRISRGEDGSVFVLVRSTP